MSEWKSRKFWKDVSVEQGAEGWSVLLDGRPIRTPYKSALDLPTEALARMIAREWAEQGDLIRPDLMPATRMANSAIDKVIPQWSGVVDVVAAFGETDLLCYRADSPDQLVALQAEGWDPMLEWASSELGVRLRVAKGVIPVLQEAAALERLRAEVDALDPFGLAAMHDLVGLTGSLVLGLAVGRGFLDPERAWDLSRIDEDWQISRWGHDDEAEIAARRRRGAFLEAYRFFLATRPEMP